MANRYDKSCYCRRKPGSSICSKLLRREIVSADVSKVNDFVKGGVAQFGRVHLLEDIMPSVMWRSPSLQFDLENRFIFTAVRGLEHLIEKKTPGEESGNIIPWQPMPVEGERYTWVEPFPLSAFKFLKSSTVSFVVGNYRFKRRYSTQLITSEWGPQTWVGFSVVSCTVASVSSVSRHELLNVTSEGGEQDRYWLWLTCGPEPGEYRTLKVFDYQEERVFDQCRRRWEDIDHEMENFRDYQDDGMVPGLF